MCLWKSLITANFRNIINEYPTEQEKMSNHNAIDDPYPYFKGYAIFATDAYSYSLML